MSSDNFQTQYASFMENMLKSAVAETTKLYETMVDELKEEISRIKKENEDLKTKCSQFENAKSQPAADYGENEPLRGKTDDSEKCDTAVQCDIVSFRTVLVEQCQPLGQSSVKNQQLLYAGEGIGSVLQEQGGNSQMTLIVVKQEESYCDTSLQPVVKQEEVESPVASEQGFSNESSSLRISLNGTESEGALINQEGSTVETTSTQKDEEMTELPCSAINGTSEGAQSHISDPEHSIVISLAVMKDNIKEEFEVHQEISEGEIQVPLQSQGDSETLANEQTVSAQPEEQLAESILINKEVASEELKNNVAEDEATPKTNLSVCHSGGQPAKKTKQAEILGSPSLDALKDQEGSSTPSVTEEGVDALPAVDAVKSSSTPLQSSSGQPNESVGTSSVQEMATIALQDMDGRKDGSLPASVLSVSGCSSTEKPKNSGVEKEAVQVPSVEVSSSRETLKSPQLTPDEHKQRCSSVTLQDAMLLVEAMNQSPLESVSPSSQRKSRPQTRRGPCVDALQTVDEIPAEPQTIPVKSKFAVEKNAAPIVFVTPKQPPCNPLTPRIVNINKARITVVPRVGSSNEAALSTEKGSTTESTAAHSSFLAVARLPMKTPSLPCLPQKVDTTSMKSSPDSQLSKPSANDQSGGPERKKITIIVSRWLAGGEASKHQSETSVLKAMEKETASHDVPVTETSGQSATTSQELSVLSSSDTALPKKTEIAADNLESPKQTDCVSEISTPTDDSTSLEQPVKKMPTSVFTAVQRAAKQRCPAVVKLAKISVSANETVLLSSLRLKGVSAGTTQEKSSKPAGSSSNISLNLTETPIAVSQKSDESNNNQEKPPLTSKASTHSEAPAVISVEPTPSLDSSEVQENESPAIIQLTPMPDPHSRMTQIQFLAQLAVSPIVQEPAKKANTNSLVTRLRRHLKTRSEARRAERKPEGNSKSENTTVSSKKDGVDNGSLNNSTEKTRPIRPKKTNDHNYNRNVRDDDHKDNDHNRNISSRMVTNDPSISLIRSRMCSRDLPEMMDNEPTSVTSESCKAASDSTLMCPTRDSTHGHSVGTEHTKSTPISPRECNSRQVTPSSENTYLSPRRSSGTDGDCTKNKKSMSMSLRRSASGRGSDCPENKKSTSESPRSSASGRDGDGPENKKSTSESLTSASGRDGDCPENKKSTSESLMSSASGRDGDGPKNQKSTSESLMSSASGRDGDGPENQKSISESPRSSASGRDGDGPENQKSMSESLTLSASGRDGDGPENQKSTSESLTLSASGRDGDCPENKKSISESPRSSASGRDGDCPENQKSISESPRSSASGRDGDCPENQKSISESPRSSASGRDGDGPENQKSISESPRSSASGRDADGPENKKSISESPRSSASGRDADGPENKKSTSESLTSSASGRDGDCPENQKSISESPRSSASGRDGDSPENKKSMSGSLTSSASGKDGDGPENQKSTSESLTLSATGRDGDCPENQKSTSESPRSSASGRDGDSLKKKKSMSVSLRSSASGRDGDGPEYKKSMYESLRSSSSGRDGNSPKNKKSMSDSPRSSASDRGSDCPENKKSMSESLRSSASGRDGDSPKNKKSMSDSARRSASGRDGDYPEYKKSMYESLRSSSSGRDGDSPKNKKSMSDSARRSASGRDGDSPEYKKSMYESLRSSSSGRDGDSRKNKKSRSEGLRTSASGRDGDVPKNKKSVSDSLRRSASGRDGDCPENKKSRSESLTSSVSGRDGDCPENKKSMSESLTLSVSGRDGDCQENKKPMSESPRSSASGRDGDCLKNKKSMSESLRSSVSGRDGDCPENKKSRSESLTSASGRDGDCLKNMKSMSVSLRRSTSGRDGDCSINKKSMSDSPRRSASGRGEDSNNKKSGSLTSKSSSSAKENGEPKMTENGASPRYTKSSSMSPVRSAREAVSPRTPNLRQSGSRRSSVFNKDDSRAKRVKRESSSSRHEISSPTVKSPTAAKNGISPKTAETPTPAKKPRLIQDVIGPKQGFKVVSVMKLSKAANAKKIANIKKSNKSKLQTGRKNQTKSDEVKKCKAKVWIPPVMTESKMSSAEEEESSLSPDDSSPSKVVPSPIVSPLQPLLVMGRHLLRNQCGECGRILSSTAALENHVSLHTGDRPFLCTFCGKSFPDSKSFKGHDRVHRNGRIHICQHCGKGFVYRFGLTKHIQMVHRRIKPFICQICSKGFFTKRDVEAHIRIHTGEKPFQCTQCERRFKRKVELNVHLRWHNGEKRHWCPYCGKGFLDYNNLKRHKYTHTGEKPHSCPICQKKFTQTAHVKKHVQNVHGGQ